MLEQITTENISVGVHATDWEDAVRLSSEYMLETHAIEQSYIYAMIEALHRLGPYIVLGKHVALAHARPEQGVNKLSVHFTTLTPPIPFGNDKFDPVCLIITLAATDANSHLELISELADILIEEENINRLSKCQTKMEFLNLLNQLHRSSNETEEN